MVGCIICQKPLHGSELDQLTSQDCTHWLQMTSPTQGHCAHICPKLQLRVNLSVCQRGYECVS